MRRRGQLHKNHWHFYLYCWLLFERWWLTFSISLPWKDIQSPVMKSLVPLSLPCHLSIVADQARSTVPDHNWTHSMCELQEAISSGLMNILQQHSEETKKKKVQYWALMVEVTIRGEHHSYSFSTKLALDLNVQDSWKVGAIQRTSLPFHQFWVELCN